MHARFLTRTERQRNNPHRYQLLRSYPEYIPSDIRLDVGPRMGQQLAMGPIFCIFYRHRSSSGLLSLRWDSVKRESQGTHIRPVQWWFQHDWKPLGDTYVYIYISIYLSTSKRNYITKLNNNLYVTSWPSSGGIVFMSLQHTSTVSVFFGVSLGDQTRTWRQQDVLPFTASWARKTHWDHWDWTWLNH